jgi:hypothetical protein
MCITEEVTKQQEFTLLTDVTTMETGIQIDLTHNET